MKIIGSCHCGAVTFEAASEPKWLVSCNCSICWRLGALWVHAPPAVATVDAPANSTTVYIWGDRGIEFHSCSMCGCTTHWASVSGERIAVNMRLADPEAIKHIRIRHWDGADSWDWLD